MKDGKYSFLHSPLGGLLLTSVSQSATKLPAPNARVPDEDDAAHEEPRFPPMEI
jgi:hypothetical protein